MEFSDLIKTSSISQKYHQAITSPHFWEDDSKEMNYRRVYQELPSESRGYFSQLIMNLAAGYGHLEAMKWLSLQGVPLTVGMVERASKGHHHEVVDWLVQQKLRLDPRVIEAALVYGELGILTWMVQEGVTLHKEIIGRSVTNENMEWLEEHGLLPSSVGAGLAAMRGDLEFLKWLTDRGDSLAPWIANCALEHGHQRIFLWLAHRGIHPIKPRTVCTPGYHDLEILKWLLEKGHFRISNKEGSLFVQLRPEPKVLPSSPVHREHDRKEQSLKDWAFDLIKKTLS